MVLSWKVCFLVVALVVACNSAQSDSKLREDATVSRELRTRRTKRPTTFPTHRVPTNYPTKISQAGLPPNYAFKKSVKPALLSTIDSGSYVAQGPLCISGDGQSIMMTLAINGQSGVFAFGRTPNGEWYEQLVNVTLRSSGGCALTADGSRAVVSTIGGVTEFIKTDDLSAWKEVAASPFLQNSLILGNNVEMSRDGTKVVAYGCATAGACGAGAPAPWGLISVKRTSVLSPWSSVTVSSLDDQVDQINNPRTAMSGDGSTITVYSNNYPEYLIAPIYGQPFNSFWNLTGNINFNPTRTGDLAISFSFDGTTALVVGWMSPDVTISKYPQVTGRIYRVNSSNQWVIIATLFANVVLQTTISLVQAALSADASTAVVSYQPGILNVFQQNSNGVYIQRDPILVATYFNDFTCATNIWSYKVDVSDDGSVLAVGPVNAGCDSARGAILFFENT